MKEEKVSSHEIDEIFKNLNGPKRPETYRLAGHEDYLIKDRGKWAADISAFLGE